jgi:ABC-type Zn uptake system ZnuABC Zn-binding protein ZnuA
MFIRRLIPVLVLAGALLVACAGVPPSASGDGVKALASTTFLADIAQNVAGSRLQVESLLPLGADPHSYEPTPQDVARIADSNVLIANGADYERFLESLLQNAGGQRTVIEASAGLKLRGAAEGEHAVDPHLWVDPNNVIRYVENIRDGLSQVDPDGRDVYASNALAYIEQLQALDAWIQERVSAIPPERRLLVTNHESLGYFADRYGFTVVGALVPSFSSQAAPSAQQMAALVDQIKATGARAIFLDAADSPNLADQIASEVSVSVVSELYIESLTGADGPAPTYIEMMRHNVTRVVDALK